MSSQFNNPMNYGFQGWPGSYPAPTPIVPPAAPKQEVQRVHGREGAQAYPLSSDSSVLLLDETAPRVWLKTTDSASYPTLHSYKLVPDEDVEVVKVETPKPVEENSFQNELLGTLQNIERMLAENGKSNTPTVRTERTSANSTPNVTGSKADQRHDRNAAELKQS